ncbi:peptidoglycan-associated lipoprotein Pal [Minwuia thermotolerans]|uniref:Peptidoglycan-associated lipoprotein n=1 Tax=Minwuia thermotolerans TaxID=2056226 RepID=A0A2M9G4P1_9PROT|nr:peptidoglycan-associated lipoprotein Pal [Minwuia thermotolerans]PJK29356.1 peptidoglycan-associated lipoprotein [Minwuia thermotolerans]PJK30459.1 peptidoglycan-associated lipoprotein [Minwuia thermotolerans]PJK30682.1 peptidoglycan-associated lipoprotein [Minwuia thermotolerans]
MRQRFLIKMGSLAAALFLVAACGEEEPVTTTSDTGGGQAQAAPAPAPQAEPSQPAGPQPGTQEHFVLNVGDRVFFDFDRYDLDAEDIETLRRQAAYLQQFPSKNVVIEGHADERGTREYNLGLGDRRATSVKDYLVSLGVAPGRITTISYGKERPVALGHNEEAWAQNRRAVTVIAN